jgi:hypothetical protein
MEPEETPEEQIEETPVQPVIIETGPEQPIIRLDELLSMPNVLLEKEHKDLATLQTISNPNTANLRLRMTDWALRGFPQLYELFSISILPSPFCSDGVQRDLYNYIVFISTKSLNDHVDLLRAKLPDFKIDYEYTGTSIRLLVSKV